MLNKLIRVISLVLCAAVLMSSLSAELIQAGRALAEDDIVEIIMGIDDSDHDLTQDTSDDIHSEDALVMDMVAEDIPQETIEAELQEISFIETEADFETIIEAEADPSGEAADMRPEEAPVQGEAGTEVEGMQAVRLMLQQSLAGSSLYGYKGISLGGGELLYYSLADMRSEHVPKKDKYSSPGEVGVEWKEIPGNDEYHDVLWLPVVYYECTDEDCDCKYEEEYVILLLADESKAYYEKIDHSYDEYGRCDDCGHKCSHKIGSYTQYETARSSTYKGYDAGWHETTDYYSGETKVCNSCYADISHTAYSKTRTETYLEPHYMDGGSKCDDCGFVCKHPNATTITEKNKRYTDEDGYPITSNYNKTYHYAKYAATRTYSYCPDCGVSYNLQQSKISKKKEKHTIILDPQDDYAYGTCELCYKDFDYSKCSHKKKKVTPNAKQAVEYSSKNAEKHYKQVTTYELVDCSSKNCSMKGYMESGWEEYEEPHRWNEYWQCADCGVIAPNRPINAIESITLDKTSIMLGKNESYKITASVYPADTYAVYTYKVKKGTDYAKVSEDGVVTVKKAGGKATITVTATNRRGSKSAEIKVQTFNAPTKKKTVTANPKKQTLAVGASMQIKGKFAEGYYCAIQFSSSNPSVATVDPYTGMVTARSVGSCDIVLTASNGITAKCALTVTSPPTDVTLSPASFVLGELMSASFTAGMIPDKAFGKISVQVADPSIATVTMKKDGFNGTIKGKKAGKTSIIVSTDTGLTRSYPVEVRKAPYRFSLVETYVTSSMDIGYYTIVPLIHPLEMTSFTYTSSNTKVATVSKDGVVTFKKAGKVTITVKTHNRLQERIELTITKKANVTLSESSIQTCMHEKPKLKIDFTPENCNKEYTTFSRDESICTFGSDGVITPKGIGTTTVGVELFNGKIATCQVTVRPEITGPSDIKTESISLPQGSKVNLQISANLADGTPACDHFKTYESMDTSIVKINTEGKVTKSKVGSTEVKVVAHNGVVFYCPVQVLNVPEKIQVYRKDDPEAKKIGAAMDLLTGDSFDLDVRAADGTYCEITWSSNNPDVVSVDSATGMVRAIKKGEAKITANVKSTGIQKTIKMKVEYAKDTVLAFASNGMNEWKFNYTDHSTVLNNMGNGEMLLMVINSRNELFIGQLEKWFSGKNTFLVQKYKKEILDVLDSLDPSTKLIDDYSDSDIMFIFKTLQETGSISVEILEKHGIKMSKRTLALLKNLHKWIDVELDTVIDVSEVILKLIPVIKSWTVDFENGLKILEAVEEMSGNNGYPEYEMAMQELIEEYSSKAQKTINDTLNYAKDFLDGKVDDFIIAVMQKANLNGGLLYRITNLGIDIMMKLTGGSEVADECFDFVVQLENQFNANEAYRKAFIAVHNGNTKSANINKLLISFEYAKQSTIQLYETMIKMTKGSEKKHMEKMLEEIKNLSMV